LRPYQIGNIFIIIIFHWTFFQYENFFIYFFKKSRQLLFVAMSFLIVIYCILATRQANGSCLQQLSKRFRCSQAIIGNSWQIRVRALVFNATINNISVISVAVTFIGRGNCSTWKKPLTCRKSQTNFIT
jgi:hypothetical protein